ncbi:MAG: hypothetical protein GY759_18930 [Chloroflexi bacterium]|nr:hypothetical protein [Chloroflexota bacterium]
MIVEARPLVDITQEAIKVLFQKLGTVNTIRFLNQFTIGYGDYMEEREELFGHLTLDDMINDIKQHQEVPPKSP